MPADHCADRTPAEVDAALAISSADLLLKELEAEEKRAVIRKELAEAIKAEADAASLTIDLEKKQELRDIELATDHRALIYRFNKKVDEASVDSCIANLASWARRYPGQVITVIWDSPGGSVTDGLHLLDYIRELSAAGTPVVSKTMGVAASMAGILAVTVGEKRVMGREAVIMLHEPSFGAIGKLSDVQDRTDWVKATTKRIANMIAARSNLSSNAVMKMMERKETWLDSDAALKHGLVDEVV